MSNTYTLNIAGVKRELPLIKINENLTIASFVILGDTELIAKTAPLLAKKLPKVDVLVTAEAKGIPLVYEISKILEMKEYIVARKSIKPYMDAPIVDEVVSITSQKKQILCLDGLDEKKIKGKKVAIIDDVISTGESLLAVERLVEKAGGIIVAKAAILAEGDAHKRGDIIFLEKLPLFPGNYLGSSDF
ncbi:phosphoribosyltransferase family protein [Clostridium lundense]|uniref:phosphoribosyltransferase family protein n=1 Tax=Clostridium lundense TaxID=319475 RepID=UPI00048A33E5|nr:phosphoribosyltransferase family protein [Clostridium lundense]